MNRQGSTFHLIIRHLFHPNIIFHKLYYSLKICENKIMIIWWSPGEWKKFSSRIKNEILYCNCGDNLVFNESLWDSRVLRSKIRDFRLDWCTLLLNNRPQSFLPALLCFSLQPSKLQSNKPSINPHQSSPPT